MVKIAHFVVDTVFTDIVIDFQSKYKNWDIDYYFVKPSRLWKNFEHIKNSSVHALSRRESLSILQKNKYNAVFLESLTSFPIDLLSKIDESIKVFWFAFGFDMYQFPRKNPFIEEDIYLPLTSKQVVATKENKFREIASRAKSIILARSSFLKKDEYVYAHRALERIDFFGGVMEYEYDLMKKNNSDFTAEPVVYKYMNEVEYDEKKPLNNGKNIIVGNSAAPTNNHLDIIQYLRNLELKDRKIIVPLSYAGPEEYINIVKQKYKELFGDTVLFLDTFIPYEEYSRILDSCEVSIYAYQRQQGIGNINDSIFNGNKVFLSKTCPVYDFYKSIGLRVFSLEDELNNDVTDTKLPNNVVESNRRIIKKRYSLSEYLKELEYIYQKICY